MGGEGVEVFMETVDVNMKVDNGAIIPSEYWHHLGVCVWACVWCVGVCGYMSCGDSSIIRTL